MKVKLIILFSMALIPMASMAQTIEGHIMEKEMDGTEVPLIGANVYWDGTTIGTTTDGLGQFSLSRPNGTSKLIISFVGYKPDTIFVSSNQTHVHHTISRPVEMEGVVVEGMAPGAHFDRLSPIQTQNITKNELKRAACCNLSESFETNASVDVNYSDAVTGAKQIQLLGLAGVYSRIQIENIPALRGLASTFGLSYVPGSWMESIQISKGTASVANGYESITGQINVEFKKPWDEEKFFVNGYANSLGMAEASTNLSFEVTPKITGMVLAHVENMSMEVDHNHDSFLNHPLVQQYHVLNRWRYKGDNFESQVGLRLLSENRVAGQMKNENTPNPFSIDIGTRQYESFVKVGYIFDRPNTSLGLITTANAHEQNSSFGPAIYNGLQQTLYANLVFVTYVGRTNHGLKTGLSFNYDSYKERLNASDFNRDEIVPGAYLEYTYKWMEDLTLMAGLRMDHHNLYGNLLTPRIHLRYQPIKQITIRASAGKGYRSPNILAENMFLLASSRHMVFLEDIGMEEAWNMGVNLTQRYKLWSNELTISADYYRTDFINQLIVDLDRSPGSVFFYNLHGKSYSNSYQVEASYSPIDRLDLMLAYRYNDVQSTTNNVLTEKPLVSRYKAFLSTSYKTRLRKWQFDYTVHLNGGGRLPSTSHLPEEFQRGDSFPAFVTMNAQVSKYFWHWEAYLGVENLTSYTQKDPIISPENPYSPFFDASMVWGPLTGRKFYLGFRYTLTK